VIRRSETGLRIVADAHLEWLDIDGLPLAIRKNVCRVPATPGKGMSRRMLKMEERRCSP
jgi:hypothetical protein